MKTPWGISVWIAAWRGDPIARYFLLGAYVVLPVILWACDFKP